MDRRTLSGDIHVQLIGADVGAFLVTFDGKGGTMVILLPRSIHNVRKRLSADALDILPRAAFRDIPDHRQKGTSIPLVDALMSAFAMFSLKDPSLLAFDERRHERNLHNLYVIEQIPSDTPMREILDPLDPERLRPVYGDVFRELQRGKSLEPFVFLDGCYLLLLDGTGYSSSQAIHCDGWLQKKNKQTGEVTYQHQLLGAAIAHPGHREVISWPRNRLSNRMALERTTVNGTPPNDCWARSERNTRD